MSAYICVNVLMPYKNENEVSQQGQSQNVLQWFPVAVCLAF